MAKTLTEWIKQASDCQFPVLAASKRRLVELLDNEDNIKVDDLLGLARLDPGFSISLLREAGIRSRKKREITTLSHAILLLSIPATIKLMHRLPVLEQTVKPELAYRIKRLYFYQHLNGSLAMAWSIQRQESENNELFTAGVNHDFLYLILYLTEFDTAIKLYNYSTSSLAELIEKEKELLGYSVEELSSAIAQAWHLPYLIRESFADKQHSPKLAGIRLASEVVQWLYIHKCYDYPEKLFQKVTTYMRVNEQKTHVLINRSIVQAFRNTHGKLPPGNSIRAFMSHPARLDQADKQSTPVNRKENLLNCIELLRKIPAAASHIIPIKQVINTLHDTIGFTRTAFFFMNHTDNCLDSAITANDNASKQLARLLISLELNRLFEKLMQKEVLLIINDDNKHKYLPHMPPGLVSDKINECMLLHSLKLDGKPYGCFVITYDKGTKALSEAELNAYKTITRELKSALKKLQSLHKSQVA
ncbi:MAG: HDOD domain-containing protein [Gammaproteobacteria bacterium]